MTSQADVEAWIESAKQLPVKLSYWWVCAPDIVLISTVVQPKPTVNVGFFSRFLDHSSTKALLIFTYKTVNYKHRRGEDTSLPTQHPPSPSFLTRWGGTRKFPANLMDLRFFLIYWILVWRYDWTARCSQKRFLCKVKVTWKFPSRSPGLQFVYHNCGMLRRILS